MSQTVVCDIHPCIQLRFLCPNDMPRVKALCADCFPIEYPDSWYRDITSSPNFYSLAATCDKQIIGMIICEVKPVLRLSQEDADILSSYYKYNSQVAYILSLGVAPEFRRKGIASLLLNNLLHHLHTPECKNCKVVYLHVLTDNTQAIEFYERRGFMQHSFLPYYYVIQGVPSDGYSYVYHINGGRPPCNLYDTVTGLVRILMRLRLCSLPSSILQYTRDTVTYLYRQGSTKTLPVDHYS